MKIKQLLIMALCMVLAASISVVATIAYFTDSETVTNTFTVGKVEISMDEADTDNSTADKDRDQANEYHLVPGQEYDKDPIVHVTADSEDCWLYVKVENGLAGIQKGVAFTIKGENGAQDTTVTRTVEQQIEANGWLPLGVANVWYRAHDKDGGQLNYTVFTNFAIKDEAHNKAPAEGTTDPLYINGYDEAEIKVTAYAIQMAGFEGEPVDAWNAYNDQNDPDVDEGGSED